VAAGRRLFFGWIFRFHFCCLRFGVMIGGAVFAGLGAQAALILENVGAVPIEAAVSGV
jgi:hypothetical protein